MYFIAEIASAHGGSFEKLLSLLDLCNELHADYTKIQIFDVKELILESDIKSSDLSNIEISRKNWIRILEESDDKDYRLIGEPYDDMSLDLCIGHKSILGIKIPASETSNKHMLQKVAANYDLVFLSIGGSLESEIDAAVGTIMGVNPSCKLILMHGFQNFPTQIKDVCIQRITNLKSRYNKEVGYADHVDATDSFASITVPLLAIAFGASYIEKHITLSRTSVEYDRYSALTPDEFANFKDEIIKCVNAIGTGTSFLSDAEISYRNKMKRFAVLASDVQKDEILDLSNIIFRRTGHGGLDHLQLAKLVGMRFSNALSSGTVLKAEHLG